MSGRLGLRKKKKERGEKLAKIMTQGDHLSLAGELVAVACSDVRVLVSNCWIVGLCDRFHGFVIILEVTFGNVIIVLAEVGVLGGFIVKAFCHAFVEQTQVSTNKITQILT